MFKEIPGGTLVKIPDAHGVDFDCWIPPVGFGINAITGELEKTHVAKRSTVKSEQYWEREPLPAWYAKKRAAEEKLQDSDPDFIDPECERVRAERWQRRLCGMWFYNNGVPTYLTGRHWFLLNEWPFQGKYFDFRITNMEFAYVFDYCYEDPNCLGTGEIMKRKDGKCFKINTLIRMYDGSVKKIQDIKDGELVMGDDSTSRMAYGCTSGEEDMYEVVPNKGESFTVNGSHVMYVSYATNKKVPGTRKNQRYSKILKFKAREYASFTKGQKERMQIIRKGWGDYAPVQHIVDPYFLGVWLGDGVSKLLQITNEDPEVVSYLKEFCLEHNLTYRNFGERSKAGNPLQHALSQRTENALLYKENDEWKPFINKQSLMRHLGKHIKTPLAGFGKYLSGDIVISEKKTNVPWNEFRRMGLPSNKHIPKEYLIDSRENRLKLLAGLIDTDGCFVSKNGIPVYHKLCFSNKYPGLISTCVELIRSLGFACNIKHESRSNSTALAIYGDIWKIPCRVKRKQAWKVKRKYDSMMTGFTMRPVGLDKYYGFAVDDNHLFLLADGTVVHNTARAGCWMYEYISRNASQHGGIQSKSDDDAEEFFQKAIVSPWQKLPHFFRPNFDHTQGSNPKKELRFFNSSIRGRAAKNTVQDKALESWIDYRSAVAEAYDGPELPWYVSDECGKLSKVSILKRHDTVRFCSEIDGEFRGFFHYTTTVEEMESGGSEFKELVKMSDRRKLDKNGRTASGLYFFFIPTHRTLYFDKYGFPDVEKAKKFLLNTREGLQSKPEQLSSFIRKNPMTLEEAFRVDGEKCLFDPQKLNEQLDSISWKDNLTTRGRFQWKDGEPFTKVEWVADKQGPFEVTWLFDKYEDANKVQRQNGQYIPMNDHLFVSGVDPFKFDAVKDNRRSNCAGFVFKKFDVHDQHHTHNEAFICKYKFRANTTSVQYDDILKMCWYYGCKALIENNIGTAPKDWFTFRKCRAFLITLPGETEPGIYTDGNGKVTQQIADYTQSYINNDIHKMYFKDVIEDWLEFDTGKTTRFDLAMAAGFTLIAAKRKVYRRDPEKSTDISQFYRSHSTQIA